MLRFSFLGILGFSSAVTLFLSGCGGGESIGGVASGGDFAGAMPLPDDPESKPPAGTLTAGEWDDNLNFSLFQAYLAEHHQQSLASGIQGSAALASADRVVIQVQTADGKPISNAHIEVADPTHSFLSVTTGSDGRALFFPGHDGAAGAAGLSVTVQPPAGQADAQALMVPAPQGDAPWIFTLPGAVEAAPQALDLAFVIDATGSMGDEIEYLKSEVKGIVDAVHSQFASVSIHYGLIIYRDDGDAFVTRRFDFTPSLELFSLNLSGQSADGGGDQPEAMDQAMELVPELSWRAGNTARMTFLVADAPPHAEDGAAYLDAVNALRPQGIRLYPVASSGVDTEAEYFLRVGAEATLGRYLFLTDDSGVGDPHALPHIPCFQVQKLSALISRMVASELAGARIPAAQADVLRSVGDPENGVCTLESGEKAYF